MTYFFAWILIGISVTLIAAYFEDDDESVGSINLSDVFIALMIIMTWPIILTVILTDPSDKIKELNVTLYEGVDPIKKLSLRSILAMIYVSTGLATVLISPDLLIPYVSGIVMIIILMIYLKASSSVNGEYDDFE